ncbi:MAG: hypothetical protein CM1200mP2_53980 [Planctomycetaceae bacterium]|nr:MAG: hypothetical protein CM1200mP2_53980 [Planctomycetaceae bacterium]
MSAHAEGTAPVGRSIVGRHRAAVGGSADADSHSDGGPRSLGTQLNVDVGASSTLLNVNKGPVRLTRLVDGQVVEVPAAHQLVASVDGNESLEPAPGPNVTGKWASRFIDDPFRRVRQVVPASLWLPGRLRATPLPHPPCGKKKTVVLHLAVVSVSRDESTAVILRRGSTIRVRGRMDAIVDTKSASRPTGPEGVCGQVRDRGAGHRDELVDGNLNSYWNWATSIRSPRSSTRRYRNGTSTGLGCHGRRAGGLELVQVELLPPQDRNGSVEGVVAKRGRWVEDWWVEWGSVDFAEPATDRSTRQDDPNTESR